MCAQAANRPCHNERAGDVVPGQGVGNCLLSAEGDDHHGEAADEKGDAAEQDVGRPSAGVLRLVRGGLVWQVPAGRWCRRGAGAAGCPCGGRRLRLGLTHAASMRVLVPGRVSAVGVGFAARAGRAVAPASQHHRRCAPYRRYIDILRRSMSSGCHEQFQPLRWLKALRAMRHPYKPSASKPRVRERTRAPHDVTRQAGKCLPIGPPSRLRPSMLPEQDRSPAG